MKYFEIQEKMIRLAKKSETDKQQKIVDNANAQIKIAQRVQAANDYLASRYEDGLKTINDEAEKINNKYDEQFKSLDKIQKVNEIIARQEQGRLSVAQALSEGDVYAAARAAQELRAQNAANAIDQQRTGMENARDNQINNLTSNGLTRDQLEEKIKNLKDQNYRIEQDTIAPLQEQARLAQVQLDIIEDKIKQDVESLRLAGLTKDQWEEQNTKIEAAVWASGRYNKAIGEAVETVKILERKWQDVIDKMNEYNNNQVDFPGPTGAGKKEIRRVKNKNGSITIYYDDGTEETIPAPASSSGSGGGGGNTGGGLNPQPQPQPKPQPKPTVNLFGGQTSYAQGVMGAGLSGTSYIGGVMGSKAPTSTSKYVSPIASAISRQGATASPSNLYALNQANLAALKSGKPSTFTSAVKKKYMGGMISKFASGGFAVGTDTVPAMLTPGEFIVSKYGVDKFGVDNLRAINKGENPSSSSVYNYNLSVNVKSDANPNEIARTVMMQIKQIDSQRIKGNRI